MVFFKDAILEVKEREDSKESMLVANLLELPLMDSIEESMCLAQD